MGRLPLTPAAADATCAARRGTDVAWMRVAPAGEARALDRLCAAVGPPARIAARQPQDVLTGPLVVVAWNTHIGTADVDAFVADLRAGRLTGARPVSSFVLLLQEVFRAGDGARRSIDVTAARLGLNAVYVPSMHNGPPRATNDDRGNAILSTLALSDVTAIELPVERQRRVAVEATIPSGIRVVSTHFTNMVMHHLWLFSEPGRARQAEALARALPPQGSLVVGGDFNAWFGFHDAAYRTLARQLRPAPDQDRRPTFGPLRLDHLLFRVPASWRVTVRRADDRYGSDHYPLIAIIELS